MNPTSDIVPITVRAPEPFRRQAQSKAKAEGTSVQAVVMAFLQRWLNGEHAPDSESEPGAVFPEHADWHKKLEFILNHGAPEDCTGIQRVLDWAANDIRSRSTNPRGRRKAV